MSRRQLRRLNPWRQRARRAARWLRGAAAHLWRALRGADPVPIVVLLVDPDRRRAVERELRAGLRQLRPVLGDAVAHDLAIVVQLAIPSNPRLAGCCHVGQRPDGGRRTLLRLALRADGRTLGSDELLAVLAEQCVAVAVERSGPSALLPFELGTGEPAGVGQGRRPTDPLAPHPDGRAGDPTERAA
jgi:hypothetical protein